MDLYEQAVEIWEQENDAHGLALGTYRKAEIYWRDSDAATADTLLSEAHTLLEIGGRAAQEDIQLIQDAQEAVVVGRDGAWRPWRWQQYDDAFRISILFRP
jgi:hypothetical protein